jgi:3-phenylpropionate/trans-cinnamate dioxygenase ferredoxin subunit
MTSSSASTTPDAAAASRFRPVIEASALAEGRSLAVEIDGRPIVLWRSGGEVFALDNLCPHFGSRLDGGRMANGVLACPLHGARFDLATGRCLSAALGLEGVVVHAARIAGGAVEVALSSRPMTRPRI